MIKVFIPIVKAKYNKPKSRGFWQNDKNKIYYDYVKIVNYSQSIEGIYYNDLFYKYLETIKASYNQEAIFFVNGSIGNVYYSKDKIEILPHRIYKEVLRSNLKQSIKEALKNYKGITVYKEDKKYFIEVFTTI